MKIVLNVLSINLLYSLPKCYSEMIIYNYYNNDKHKVSEALGGRYISKIKKEELIEFIAINGLL